MGVGPDLVTVGWLRPIKKWWAGIFPYFEWRIDLRSRMHLEEYMWSVMWRTQEPLGEEAVRQKSGPIWAQ